MTLSRLLLKLLDKNLDLCKVRKIQGLQNIQGGI